MVCLQKPTPRTTTRHHHGGVSLWEVIEQIQLAEGVNPEKLLTSHVYGVGIDDEVAYRLEDYMPAVDFWSHRDDLNSLTSVTDINGDVQERYHYGDFGQVTIFDPANGEVRTGSSAGAIHLYTGRSMIAGTGLQDSRWRVLDLETGRFRQRDPLGFIDGMSMYSYVTSNPMTYVDPFGLNVYGIDGTHADRNEGTNVNKFVDATSEPAHYWGGPDDGLGGDDAYKIADDVYNKIMSDLESDPNITINIIAWSRGGQIALMVVDRLNDDCIEVNFLGIFDGVNMVNPNFASPFPWQNWNDGDVVDIFLDFRSPKMIRAVSSMDGTFVSMEDLPREPTPNVANFAHAMASVHSMGMITINTQQGNMIYGPGLTSQNHNAIGFGAPAYSYVEGKAAEAGVGFGPGGTVGVTPSPNSGAGDGDKYILIGN